MWATHRAVPHRAQEGPLGQVNPQYVTHRGVGVIGGGVSVGIAC